MKLVPLYDINVCGTPFLAKMDFSFKIVSSADTFQRCKFLTMGYLVSLVASGVVSVVAECRFYTIHRFFICC